VHHSLFAVTFYQHSVRYATMPPNSSKIVVQLQKLNFRI